MDRGAWWNLQVSGHKKVDGMDNSQMKKYYWWVPQILQTELNSKHKITAIIALAVTVLVYNFGIFSWLRKETEKIVRKTRKLTIEGIHHPKADVNRLYIKIQNGGLVNLETTHNTAIVGLIWCITQDEDMCKNMTLGKPNNLYKKKRIQ
jgi:hypothetical protein